MLANLQLLAFLFLVVMFLTARWTWRSIGRPLLREMVRGGGQALGAWLIWDRLDARKRRREERPRPVLADDDMYAQCRLSRFTGDPATCRWCAGPLPTRSKRFCRPQCRTTARTNHEFSLGKDEVLRRDGYRCKQCGAEATHERALEVHHAHTPARGRHAQHGCWHHVDGLVTLCWRCHLKETNRGRRVS